MEDKYDLQPMANAEEFLNFIRRSNSRWLKSDKRTSSVIFRGQPNSEHTLLPSAWRDDNASKKIFNNIKNEVISYFQHELPNAASLEDQVTNIATEINPENVDRISVYAWKVLCELYLADEFIGRANNIGLKISKVNPFGFIRSPIHISALLGQILKYKEKIKSILKGTATIREVSLKNYYDDNVSTFALVQHHGVSTRFLDWTKNPLKAAYFALDSIDRSTKEIAVIALDTASLGSYGVYVIDEFPHAEFHFLHVQEGVFTYTPFANGWFLKYGSWPSIEDLLSDRGYEGLKSLFG